VLEAGHRDPPSPRPTGSPPSALCVLGYPVGRPTPRRRAATPSRARFPRRLAASWASVRSADSLPTNGDQLPARPGQLGGCRYGSPPAFRRGDDRGACRGRVSWNVPRGAISPASVMSLARKPSPDRCAPDRGGRADRETRNVEAGPGPPRAPRGGCRGTPTRCCATVVPRGAPSARRNLAVDFQCTRCRPRPRPGTVAAPRRPRRWPEIVRHPAVAFPRAQLLCAVARGSGWILGVTTSRADGAERPADLHQAERVRRPGPGAAPMVNLPRLSDWNLIAELPVATRPRSRPARTSACLPSA